jgi:hypothetical protein
MMGKVSWVERLRDDGTVERMVPPGPPIPEITECDVTFHYDYGPALLPKPP